MKREAVALIDESRCVGCVRCIEACPVDAIVGAQGLMHTVVEPWCIGCALCLPPCPVDCIEMVTPHGQWTDALRRAAGERGRRRRLRLARGYASAPRERRREVLAAALGRKRK